VCQTAPTQKQQQQQRDAADYELQSVVPSRQLDKCPQDETDCSLLRRGFVAVSSTRLFALADAAGLVGRGGAHVAPIEKWIRDGWLAARHVMRSVLASTLPITRARGRDRTISAPPEAGATSGRASRAPESTWRSAGRRASAKAPH
jgi:hypothetical protein